MANEVEDEGTETTVVETERPAFLLPKFKTVEEQAKGYAELEKQFTKDRATPKGGIAVEGEVAEELPDDAGVSALLERAKLDPEVVGKTWMEKGELTEEHYAALRKQGITRTMANEHFGLLEEKFTRQEADRRGAGVRMAGGETQFTTVISWARTALSPEELAGYNEDAKGPNNAKAIRSFEWLLAKYREAVGAGKASPLIEGQVAVGASGAFSTSKEMLAMRNDKRMKTDSGFAALYNKRLAATSMDVIGSEY